MELTSLGGAATIALASASLFLIIVHSWMALSQSKQGSRFPDAIMLEAAQGFRDEHEKLGRQQSVFLITGLVFTVVFSVSYLLPPEGMFENIPNWQLIAVLLLLVVGLIFSGYRLAIIAIRRRRLLLMRDASMATGHALQKLTSNSNRVFHDVPIGSGTIDNVVVGLQGVYTVSVVARKPGKSNKARLKGDLLAFANAKETMSIARCGEKSAQLAREIRKLTGHEIRVRSVIAVPGWEIDAQQSAEYLLVNERNLAMLTGWKDRKDYLMNEDVAAIQKMLTERCTRFKC